MKVSGAKKVHYDSGPNMTPLVDVVMVILIFLMLAGQFGGAEHYLVSNLPVSSKQATVAASNQKPDPNKVPDEPLDVRVDAPTPDRWVARAGRISVSDFKSLTMQLSRMREEMNKAGKTTDKIQVIISPSKVVKYDFLIGVYQAAMEAKFEKIGFATAHDQN